MVYCLMKKRNTHCVIKLPNYSKVPLLDACFMTLSQTQRNDQLMRLHQEINRDCVLDGLAGKI